MNDVTTMRRDTKLHWGEREHRKRGRWEVGRRRRERVGSCFENSLLRALGRVGCVCHSLPNFGFLNAVDREKKKNASQFVED